MAASSFRYPIASSLSSVIQLSDGVKMPLFGLGLFEAATGPDAEDAVAFALKNGYILLDTAQIYKNEADVGRGLKKSGVKRSDVFVVTKIWNANHGYDATTASFTESLSKLETGHVDLCLIHSPLEGKNVETYKALLDLKAKGLIRSVGVSNFGIEHLKGLKDAGLPAPSVNQIELHPFCRRTELVNYCRENDIAVMGYSPLARTKKNDDPDLIEIARKHKKSIAQVMIRWGVEMGFITIPKSTKSERILENANVFDFKLSPEENQILNQKPDGQYVCWEPTITPWLG